MEWGIGTACYLLVKCGWWAQCCQEYDYEAQQTVERCALLYPVDAMQYWLDAAKEENTDADD